MDFVRHGQGESVGLIEVFLLRRVRVERRGKRGDGGAGALGGPDLAAPRGRSGRDETRGATGRTFSSSELNAGGWGACQSSPASAAAAAGGRLLCRPPFRPRARWNSAAAEWTPCLTEVWALWLWAKASKSVCRAV